MILQLVQDRIISLVPDLRLQVQARGGAWWLAGGISPINCVAAYQPKGTGNLAVSYTNLANPGTNDASEGSAPDWDSTNGWKFSPNKYLKTGLTPASNQTWSAVIRFSNVAALDNQYLFGERNSSTASQFHILVRNNVSNVISYSYNEASSVSPAIASGVLGLSGRQPYRNGSTDGGLITAATYATPLEIYMGARNVNGSPANYLTGYIQAIAFYNIAITGSQMAALYSDMINI